MIRSRKFFLGTSPLGLLSLSACKYEFGGNRVENNSLLEGHAVLGPLHAGVAFVDYDGSGTLDLASEPYVYTGSDGSFSLSSTQGLKKVVVTTSSVTAGGLPINAIDGSSGALLSGVTITGPSGASVLSPASTLLEQSSLTEAEVAKALGLEGISLTEFNPYAAGVDADNALAFEKVATQVITTVKAISAAAQGSGAAAEASSNAAFDSVVSVVVAKAAAGEALDLSDNSDLETIREKATTDLASVSGVDTTAFNKTLETAITAVGTVNRQVKLISDTDLSSSTTKGLFATADYLATQVKTAAQAELSSSGSGVGSITLVNESNVKSMASTAASNSAPTNLLASTSSFDENSAASITFTGVDEPKTSFKFGLSGNDASSFSLNSSTGVLTLSSAADFEEKSSYSIVVTVTDDAAIPLSYSKKFTFTVNDVIENGEVYESSNTGNTTFLIVDGATSGKFDVIPVKVKSSGSGYEFDTSNKTDTAYDVAADKLEDSIGRDPTKKVDASNSDVSAAKTAAETALTPSVTITAFSDSRYSTAVADGATSNAGKLYLKFTLSDSSTDFVVGDITVTGGTLSNFTGSRTEYTAEFTPSGSSKVDTTLNVAQAKFTNDYFGNTAAAEFNWTYDPNAGAPKHGEVYESSNTGNTTFLIVDGATSGKFDVIPVKVKSSGSGYEFDTSNKTDTAYDVAADKLEDSIGRDPTKKVDASNSDVSAAKTAAETALTPSVTITAFSDSRYSTAVADGATSNAGKLYLKFTLSDSSTDFVVGDITVTGGTLSNFTGSRTEYTAEFTPSGSSKVDTTLNVAQAKFTNDYFGNTAAAEFNWTYDPDNGLKDGDVIKEVDSNGDPTGKFLLLDIDSGKYSLAPVKDNGSGTYIFEDANASSGVIKASSLSASEIVREIGTSPTGNGDTISSSGATTILKQAGITAPVHGDVVKATDSNGDPTDRLLLLNIESNKYSLIPVKKDGGGAWVYDSANSTEKVTGGSGLSDTSLAREIGSTPFGAGESISDSDAFPILVSAGVIVGVYGDEKGGDKAFTAGAYDASDDLASPNSDGIGWILKSVKSFGETTTAKGEARGIDLDYFQLINSHSSPKLTGSEEYKITVADEAWNGSDTGDIARVLVKDQDGNNVSLTNSGNDYTFTANGSSDYFLEIMGEVGEDAQYSVIFDIV